MLHDLNKRLAVILGSVVTLVTGLAVAVNEFVAQVAPELPDGWQDNAVRIGVAAVAVLGFAATAIRRLTEVPPSARGVLMPPDEVLEVKATEPGGGASTITTTR
jgi:hypothetical protein